MENIPRQSASAGLWCSLLIPFSLLPYSVKYSGVCRLLGIMSFWLSMTFILKEKFVFHSTQPLFFNLITIPAAAIISWMGPYDFMLIYIIICCAMILLHWLTSRLLQHCPGSFSIGEAQVISQGVTLFVLNFSLSVLNQSGVVAFFRNTEILNSIKFFQVLIFGCLMLMFVLHKFPFLGENFIVFVPCILMATATILSLYVYLGQNPVTWLLLYCIQDYTKICLLSSWVALTLASILFVLWVNGCATLNAKTIVRKYFHLIVIVVFLPGIILDPELLNLASGVALAVFMALETCRILKVEPFGPLIDEAFQVFLDEKDSGTLILTHIYLLLGCSAPLWVYAFNFQNKVHHICLASGIISVGFGDTAAALGGSLFGKHKWEGTEKTVEGTACAVLAQLICATPILFMYHEFTVSNFGIIVVAILLTSVLEAKTTQVDNLVLPLFMYSFLSWIE